MAKMCKYYKIKYKGRTMTYCQHPDWVNGKMKASTAAIKKFCPSNTTTGCQIIPRREKMVRVKAWCVVRDSNTGEIDGCFESGNIPPKHFSSAYVPCTILISAKYLKERK